MAIRYPGRASIDPSAPQAVGVCDRCGQLYNLRDLKYQPVWAGPNILVTTRRVCTVTCWDVPNEQLRTIRIPPDPWPVSDPRVENFAVDEANHLDITTWVGKPSMFLASSLMQCELYLPAISPEISAALDGTSVLNGELQRGVDLSAALDGTSVLNGELQRGVDLSAALDGTSVLNGELELTSSVSQSVTDSFTFNANDDFTETGAALGVADSTRQIYVTISGFNITSADGVDSVSIAGNSATLAVERLDGAGPFSAIYWAAVPTGTTGDIIITFTGDEISAGVTVYRVLNADPTTPVGATADNTVTSGSVSASITPAAGSVTIATTYCGLSSSDVNISWTNITEDVDQSINAGNFLNMGSASRSDATSPGSISISADASVDIETNKTLAICNIVS